MTPADVVVVSGVLAGFVMLAGYGVRAAICGGDGPDRGQPMTAYDVRAGELLAFEAETGRALPFSVPEILALEDAGHIVDLQSGIVLVDAAETRIEPTIVADAWCIVSDATEATVQ